MSEPHVDRYGKFDIQYDVSPVDMTLLDLSCRTILPGIEHTLGKHF